MTASISPVLMLLSHSHRLLLNHNLQACSRIQCTVATATIRSVQNNCQQQACLSTTAGNYNSNSSNSVNNSINDMTTTSKIITPTEHLPPPRRTARGFLAWVWQVERVPNTGSTARDHLANERTFLAWASTGLAFLGAGVGLNAAMSQKPIEDDRDKELRKKLRVTGPVILAGMGLIFIGFSTRRYYQVLRDLQQGMFRPAKRAVLAVILSSTVIVTYAITIESDGLDFDL